MNYSALVFEMYKGVVLRFLNKSGIVTIQEGTPHIPGEGNGLLQTGLMYCIKASAEPLTETDKADIARVSTECMHHTYPIFWRSAYKQNPGDNQQHDDYWGWLAALYHAEHAHALLFYRQAENWGWHINIQNPGNQSDPNYYFDRFPGFRIFAKMCARSTAPLLTITWREHLEIALVGIWKAFTANTSDGCMRDYCFFSVVSRESKLGRAVGDLWLSRVRKRYGTVGLSFAPYFQNAGHPLVGGDWHL